MNCRSSIYDIWTAPHPTPSTPHLTCAQALEHFAQLGYPCPPHHNPAEFVADLVSPDSSMGEGEGSVPGRWGEL